LLAIAEADAQASAFFRWCNDPAAPAKLFEDAVARNGWAGCQERILRGQNGKSVKAEEDRWQRIAILQRNNFCAQAF